MALSKLSGMCSICPYVGKCKNKRMESVGYLHPATEQANQPVAQELDVKHNYRNIKIAPNTDVTIDIEIIKKQLNEKLTENLYQGLIHC